MGNQCCDQQRHVRCAARALASEYLIDAVTVLQYQREGLLGIKPTALSEHNPHVLSALISAQSTDRLSEVIAREIGLAAKRISDAIDETKEELATEQFEIRELLLSVLETLEEKA